MQFKRTTAPAQKSCTPRYPTYAPDLRDAALQAAGAQNKVFKGPTTFTMSPGTGVRILQNYTRPWKAVGVFNVVGQLFSSIQSCPLPLYKTMINY